MGNAKTTEGAQHPDRDAQFRYINKTAKARLGRGLPVISVDTKKNVRGHKFHAEWNYDIRPRSRTTTT